MGQKTRSPHYAVSQALFAKSPVPKYFLSLIGAPHEGFTTEPWSPIVNNTIAAFFNRYLGTGQTVAQIKRAGSKPGVTTFQVSGH